MRQPQNYPEEKNTLKPHARTFLRFGCAPTTQILDPRFTQATLHTSLTYKWWTWVKCEFPNLPCPFNTNGIKFPRSLNCWTVNFIFAAKTCGQGFSKHSTTTALAKQFYKSELQTARNRDIPMVWENIELGLAVKLLERWFDTLAAENEMAEVNCRLQLREYFCWFNKLWWLHCKNRHKNCQAATQTAIRSGKLFCIHGKCDSVQSILWNR